MTMVIRLMCFLHLDSGARTMTAFPRSRVNYLDPTVYHVSLSL
jgi:hypothetical protein